MLYKIFDVIKQNELKLANTDFKMKPNKQVGLFFFLFPIALELFNCLYLWNQLINFNGV